MVLFLVTSCGISEDCFKGNGSQITQILSFEDFTKIKVYEGIALVIKEGSNYDVKIVTSDKIINNLDVSLEGDMLILKDNSTCNIARNYGQTTVYITVPNLIEIHSRTEQNIKSEGVLHFSNLKLYSIDIDDGAGTGDFYLDVQSNSLYVESNNVSNFYITGQTENLHVFFSWGNGIFNSENLMANTITFYHRGSNDLIFYPIHSISGDIYNTGNVILKNRPNLAPNVTQHFRGRLIMN